MLKKFAKVYNQAFVPPFTLDIFELFGGNVVLSFGSVARIKEQLKY